MSKSNSFETQMLEHIFNNVAISDVGDAAGLPVAATAGSLYVRLYTDAVAVTDSVLGTECAYTGYAAGGVAVARSGAGWTVAGGNCSNAAIVTFAPCTGGVENVRYFAVWKDNASGLDADRLYWGQLTADLAVSNGITPSFGIGTLDVNED
jgi:hypothetical protein